MYKIAIVDDNWETCELFKVMLENLELFKVITFENGATFLDYVKEGNGFEVAIVDLDLPDIYGFDLIKYLRENLSLTLPIIVITGYGDPNYKFKALNLGADDYIVKPINMLEVLLKINNFIKKKKFIEEILNREEIIKEKANMLNIFEKFIKDDIANPLKEFEEKIKELKNNVNLSRELDDSLKTIERIDEKINETLNKIENVLKLYEDKKELISKKKDKLQTLAEIEESINMSIKNSIIKDNEKSN